MRSGNKKTRALSALAAALCLGCGTTAYRELDAQRGQYHPCGKESIRSMTDGISALNKRSPGSGTADFFIDGVIDNKKYKLQGSIQYDRKQRLMHVAFQDFIFRSPIASFFQEGDAIRIYFPVEKKLYAENAKSIDLAAYGGANIPYEVLADLMTGVIPMIPDHTVKQGLASNNGNGSMLIIENRNFYETISFTDNAPDKILLVNKSTREKFEIYIGKPVSQNGGLYFTNVIIAAINASIRFDINFSRIKMNVPVNVKTIKDVKLPRDVRLFQM